MKSTLLADDSGASFEVMTYLKGDIDMCCTPVILDKTTNEVDGF